MLESTNEYLIASREYMGRAWGYFAENDLPQASEKGWGAAAEMVKAVAEKRRWTHDSHRLLYQIIRNLVNETGDDHLSRLFKLASDLHINYYERWLPGEDVRLSLQDVQELVDRLEPMAHAG